MIRFPFCSTVLGLAICMLMNHELESVCNHEIIYVMYVKEL